MKEIVKQVMEKIPFKVIMAILAISLAIFIMPFESVIYEFTGSDIVTFGEFDDEPMKWEIYSTKGKSEIAIKHERALAFNRMEAENILKTRVSFNEREKDSIIGKTKMKSRKAGTSGYTAYYPIITVDLATVRFNSGHGSNSSPYRYSKPNLDKIVALIGFIFIAVYFYFNREGTNKIKKHIFKPIVDKRNEENEEKNKNLNIRFCSKCGNKLKIDAKFCNECGNKQ